MQSITSVRRRASAVLCGLLVTLAAYPAPAEAQSVAVLFERATAREASARKNPTVANLRAAVAAYELVVRRYPRSGYCDNALWNGAGVARFAWERHKQDADRRTAERLYSMLRKEYPSSSLARQVSAQLSAMSAANAPPASTPAATAARPAPTTAAPATSAPTGAVASVRGISVSPLPKGDRIIIELDREVVFSTERIADPDRVFFDLQRADFTNPVQSVSDALAGSRVRGVRLGRQDGQVARVVLELEGTPHHSVFQMYHPYRLVIDVESDGAPVTAAPAPVSSPPPPPTPPADAPSIGPPPAATPPPPEASIAPAPASRTAGGDYSLARQLGLGVSRIVIDPGHGGHDPGARANGLLEAGLVLDIALRVEALLKKQPGVEVVLTRRTDVYIPLEERTAIANREDADLFLSIHANAAARTTARGVETYFLNFATNPEAEAVAARENATSGTSMRRLPELVQQIALNDKVKESRELAQMVQTTMVRTLRTQNKAVLDLGVKQAPFVVLIGAKMPSVLAEISFISNRAEATLLKNEAYKQRIAQALADSVLKYQASLKKIATVAVAK
jgi:N-acetylmuramoyl-L-alanine amidase